jgi:predicted nucleotidyltransferase
MPYTREEIKEMRKKNDYPLMFKDKSQNKEVIDKRYKKALSAAKKAAKLLKEEYEAETVWIFGSLTERARFDKWSDIDLAARGIPLEKFYAAVGAITREVTQFKIDLIDVDDCKESLEKAVKKDGQKI